jgi:hypothetical protein
MFAESQKALTSQYSYLAAVDKEVYDFFIFWRKYVYTEESLGIFG